MRRIAPYLVINVAMLPVLLRAETPPVLRAPALRPGDTVAVVAPAGPLDRSRIERARTRLQQMDLKLRIPPNLYRRRGYLAGDDAERAEEFMAAWRDPAVKAILPGAGGYGCTRMLDQLDYEFIRTHPKILLGYSDITALHLAIQRKTGLITFHGPLLGYGLGSPENLTIFSADSLWRTLLAESYFDPTGEPFEPGYTYDIPSTAGTLHVLASGTARGRLTGGNLSLISALMGTPYEIETDGRILFIEDVNEDPYRIDRYLSQLRLAGKLDHVSGVILGIFNGCGSGKAADGLTIDEVFRDYFTDLGVPVITNFPAGHTRQNATLPLNALVEIDAAAREVRVLENPVDPGLEATPSTARRDSAQSAEPLPEEPGEAEEPGMDPQPHADPPPELPEDEFEPVEPAQSSPAPVPSDVLRRIP